MNATVCNEPPTEELQTAHPGVRFRPVPDYPYYRVGDDGSVWSCRTRGGKFLRHWQRMTPVPVHPDGRYIVGFRRGKQRLYRPYIHIVVLNVFVGPCPPGMEACHEDGDPTNNRLSNLRWDTHKGNAQDTIRHGRTQRGTKMYCAKLNEETVREIRRRCAAGELQKHLAPEYGVHASCIQKIVSRDSWAWLE